MEKEFNVYGQIVIEVELDVTAESEKKALEQAIKTFKEDYNLNVHGYHHEPEEVEFEGLNVIEYE